MNFSCKLEIPPAEAIGYNYANCNNDLALLFLVNSSCLFVHFLNFLVSYHNLCPSLKKKITEQVLGIYQLSPYLKLFVCTPVEGGGGGTLTYGLYRYVPRNRAWFLRFSGIFFDPFVSVSLVWSLDRVA